MEDGFHFMKRFMLFEFSLIAPNHEEKNHSEKRHGCVSISETIEQLELNNFLVPCNLTNPRNAIVF